MTALDQLFGEIDRLTPEELEQVYRHVVERRRAGYWLVTGEQLTVLKEALRPVHDEAARMTDEEINSVLDEALGEVRRERKTHRGH